MIRSLEADLYPRRDPARAEEIDGQLGDGSPFQLTYGYYAHGVGPETAKAPAGWEERLVVLEVPRRPGEQGHVRALCLECHDLIVVKCMAGRERDWDFAKAALAAGIVELDRLLALVDDLPRGRVDRDHVRSMLVGIGKQTGATHDA